MLDNQNVDRHHCIVKGLRHKQRQPYISFLIRLNVSACAQVDLPGPHAETLSRIKTN